ncbi:MAG: hypothetical protein IJS78_06100 [Clostridia bacterium]|nr:hypothetical protein [Clostridia bacterium]
MKKQAFFDKRYLKKVAVWGAISALSLAIVAYLSYHLASGFGKDLETAFARRTTLESTVTCQGYVFREETPIAAAEGGSLYSALEDGEKVRSGTVVAEVYSVPSADVEEKLALIDRQISLLQSCRTMSLTVGDTGTVDEGIFSTLSEMRRAGSAGNLAKEASLRSELFLKMKKRAVLTGEVTDFSARIAELGTEKENLKASLGAPIATVSSPASGYYYSACDGYETLFSSKNIDALTLASLGELISSEPSDVGGTAGKIVTTHKWYVACPMTRAEISKLSGPGPYRVTLGNNSECPLDMTVYKTDAASDGALAIFACDEVKEGFDFTRSQSVTVVTGETTGFKVPVSAVRMIDGVEGVYVINEIKVEFRRIDVIDESGGYYLCREHPEYEETPSAETGEQTNEAETGDETPTVPWLRQNDLIVTGGTGLSEGMTHLPPRK